MNHTTNYDLNQWEADDRVTREDFNADNAAIDAAISGCAKFAFGSYTGTGTYGEDHPNRLSCDFTPKAMMLTGVGGPNMQQTKVIVIKPNIYGYTEGNYHIRITWEDDGVSWYSSNSEQQQMNTINYPFQYVLLG